MLASRRASRDTTEWEDAQRRLGNLAPLEDDAPAPPLLLARETVADAAAIRAAPVAALEQLDEETADDRALSELRRLRLQQLRLLASRPRFGAVLAISRDQFVTQVTAASLTHQDVLVLLTRPGAPGCEVASSALDAIAAAHPGVKCVRIAAADAVGAGYPDSKLPTVLLYRRGDVALTLSGPTLCGPSLRHITPEALVRELDKAPSGPVFITDEQWQEDEERRRLTAPPDVAAESDDGVGATSRQMRGTDRSDDEDSDFE